MTFSYFLRRVAQILPTAAGVLLLAFLLIHLAPGDPTLALGGEHGDAEYYAYIRAKFGLDRPLYQQLATYAGSVVRGDLGTSFIQGRPVIHILVERIPATLLLTASALFISTAAGFLLGTAAARRVGRPGDLALRTGAILGFATPPFWLAQVALLTLAAGTGLFPIQGMTDARDPATGLGHVLDVLHHLTLPALVLAAGELALTTRLVRAGLLEQLRLDYVRTARAKGLPERRVLRHALRNGILPVTTVIGGRVGMILTGAVVVEVVFAWPGLGRLLISSVQSRDYPVVLGIFLLTSFVVIVVNLLTDLAYAWLDPRVRYR